VHNYFPPPETPFVLNIAARDEDGRTRTRALCRTAIALAGELGAPFYSVHAGFAAALKPEQLGRPADQAAALTAEDIDRDAAYAAMVETVRELADFAAGKGVGLLVENNVISPLYLEKMPINPLLLTRPDELDRFFGDVGHDNIGLLLDVGHAKVSGTAEGFAPEAFVEAAAPYLRAWHLSDNDGRADSNQPFDGNAWFMPFLKDFPGAEVVIEVYRMDAKTMRRQHGVVESAIP
jgi:sugar phosphate isomerase/epimerase